MRAWSAVRKIQSPTGRRRMSQQNGIGEIHPQAAYTMREFCRRTGISYQKARNYIPCRKMAARSFVLGEDFVEYLRQQPKLLPRQPDSFKRFVKGEDNE